MSSQFNCTNCGKTGYGSAASGPMSGSNPPSGWITKWGSTKVYCSSRCKDEYNNRKSGSSGGSGNSEVSETKARVEEAKAQENASKWNTYAKLGTAAFTAATSTGKEVKESTDYLAKLVFSNDIEELSSQLSEIIAIWGGAEKYFLADNTKAVQKAAYAKFEFGIMKLEQIGTPSQIEFFKKKQKEIKPKKFFGLF